MSYIAIYKANEYIYKKLKAIEHKGGKCVKCGYNKYHGALEFHHRDMNEKEFSWNNMRNRAWWKIIKELDKCDLMCSNCHKEAHQTPGIVDRVTAWREEIESHKVLERECPTCGKLFRPHQNRIKFCSKRCAGLSQPAKIDWPNNLTELVAESSMRKVGMQLGVSDKAVAKRLKQHHKVI